MMSFASSSCALPLRYEPTLPMTAFGALTARPLLVGSGHSNSLASMAAKAELLTPIKKTQYFFARYCVGNAQKDELGRNLVMMRDER